ncbi:MAG: alpha/beta fold hydrolase [Candidatus Obscuribacterales bacterium]|nr:alpha/beta fold hydrolase [Candidatus Obscuribacterales bacterium]
MSIPKRLPWFVILISSALLFVAPARAEDGKRCEALSAEKIASMKNEASTAFYAGKIKEAHSICQSLKDGVAANADSSSESDYTRILINLGITCLELGKPKDALAIFEAAQTRMDKDNKSDSKSLNRADILLGLAESHYRDGHAETALPLYDKALDIYAEHFSRFSEDLLPALEGLGGSHLVLDQNKEALPFFRHIAQIDLIKYGAEHPRVGKSFNNLSDVYFRLEECGGARPFFSQAIWIFRKNNLDSLNRKLDSADYQNLYSQDEIALFKKRAKQVIMGVQDPPSFRKSSYDLLAEKGFDESCKLCENKRPSNFDNWQVRRAGHFDAGFIKIDPTKEQKGLIFCLHGLGLNHASYMEFAKKIAPYGYGVVAIDVRGFGSLSKEKGFDKIDMLAGMDDLRAMVSMFRDSNKDSRIFMLGESMGGALALQFTAQFPELVDGLVSSVPSGRRFHSKKTKLLVGLRLLDDPKAPFAIGKRVINQATDNDTIKEKWLSDPANRLKISPDELLNFEAFMKHNQKYACEIKKTPVIVFQGFRDHLVRPNGTYALYQALSTRDKDLLFVGDREHLVFEEGAASDKIVSMLAAWLNSHNQKVE